MYDARWFGKVLEYAIDADRIAGGANAQSSRIDDQYNKGCRSVPGCDTQHTKNRNLLLYGGRFHRGSVCRKLVVEFANAGRSSRSPIEYDEDCEARFHERPFRQAHLLRHWTNIRF